MPAPRDSLPLSVIAPAHNEQDNVRPPILEIEAALDPVGIEYEIVIVDDGSTDGTAAALRGALEASPRLRVIRMVETPPGRGHGQSAAFHAGFRAARGEILAVLDADLQNDPADVPAMLRLMDQTGADMVQGDRSLNRRDTLVRRVSSLVGRLFRRWLLDDSIRDTGCSLRLMRREIALALPLEFRGMHRYVPLTARRLGYHVVEMSVRHRPRTTGVAKYGVWDRALPGLFDCLAVRWMCNRRRPVSATEIELGDARRKAGERPLRSEFTHARAQESAR